jgi:hypothetical protein
MTESEGHSLINMVTSKNFNKGGWAIEWHPLAVNSWKTFEDDVLEVGFLAAYYMYDENVWGEGALSYVTNGTDARG